MKSEYKKRYDPDTGRYVKKHIYSGELHGEGYKMDMLKSLGKKLFGKKTQEIAKKAVEKNSHFCCNENRGAPWEPSRR